MPVPDDKSTALEKKLATAQLKKLALETEALLKKPIENIEPQMFKIAGFSGAAILFSGTLVSIFKPPLVAPYFLLIFYGLSLAAILFSGLVVGAGDALPMSKYLFANVAIYSVVLSLLSLTTYAFSNFYSDWTEPPKIVDISTEKSVISVNESIKLSANIKNDNQKPVRYEWSNNGGILLDNEGSSVMLKAPSSPGIVKVALRLLSENGATDSREVSIAVQSTQLSPASSEQASKGISDFISRCIDAMNVAYGGTLSSESDAYEAVAVMCTSAAKSDDGSIALDEKYLNQQAKSIAERVPLHVLRVVYNEAKERTRKKNPGISSWWDQRPCCNPRAFVWPFCKIFARECWEEENSLTTPTPK